MAITSYRDDRRWNHHVFFPGNAMRMVDDPTAIGGLDSMPGNGVLF
ncbi:MAG: hypothetical protein ACMUJM_20915 [bacterium]